MSPDWINNSFVTFFLTIHMYLEDRCRIKNIKSDKLLIFLYENKKKSNQMKTQYTINRPKHKH